MEAFLIIFAIGFALLLAVQALDIECERPRRPASKPASAKVPGRTAPAINRRRSLSAIRVAR